jgi:hypothetical protein
MSQIAATQTPSGKRSPSREIAPTTAPIVALPSQPAQIFKNVHPVLVSSYFYLRFSHLIADPVTTLLTDLIPISILQCAYAIVCLPVSKRPIPPDESKTSSPKAPASRSKSTKSANSFHEASFGTRVSVGPLILAGLFFMGADFVLECFTLFIPHYCFNITDICNLRSLWSSTHYSSCSNNIMCSTFCTSSGISIVLYAWSR